MAALGWGLLESRGGTPAQETSRTRAPERKSAPHSVSARARFAALSGLSRQKSGTRNVTQIISLFGATSRTMRIFMPSCSAQPSVASTCCVRTRASGAGEAGKLQRCTPFARRLQSRPFAGKSSSAREAGCATPNAARQRTRRTRLQAARQTWLGAASEWRAVTHPGTAPRSPEGS